jgi:hypothetical protein
MVYRGPDGGNVRSCNDLWTLDVDSMAATQVTSDACSGSWGENYVLPTINMHLNRCGSAWALQVYQRVY